MNPCSHKSFKSVLYFVLAFMIFLTDITFPRNSPGLLLNSHLVKRNNQVEDDLASQVEASFGCDFYVQMHAAVVQVKENNYRGHGDSVDQLCWHPLNPELFVTASGDKTVRIWDVRSNKCAATVNTKGENINICWSPDGQTIAVGNKEDVVTFIDAKNYKTKAEEQFKFEVNEISWNNDNDLFFLTNGNGCISIMSYPELKPIQSINAHPSNCICIKFDPTGKYFATGSADALVSLWDANELTCVRCLSRLDWPVRTLSFSHDGKMLASASEDHFIDIADVDTGEKLWEVHCDSPTFTVAWHPKRPLLAFACDDKDGKYDNSRDAGTVKLFGLPNES